MAHTGLGWRPLIYPIGFSLTGSGYDDFIFPLGNLTLDEYDEKLHVHTCKALSVPSHLQFPWSSQLEVACERKLFIFIYPSTVSIYLAKCFKQCHATVNYCNHIIFRLFVNSTHCIYNSMSADSKYNNNNNDNDKIIVVGVVVNHSTNASSSSGPSHQLDNVIT